MNDKHIKTKNEEERLERRRTNWMPGKLIDGRIEDQERRPLSKASFIPIFRNIPLIVL